MPARSIEDYKIGWICALPEELTAARVMLDEEHDGLTTRVPEDGNTYVLGQIHKHNVVIACLPAGRYGTTSAAVVATNLLRTFTSVHIGLMVGIGGGITDLAKGVDIRLGDVVVSHPENTYSGVVQYDMGKNLGEGVFELKGSLNRPPSVLLAAIARLQSDHQIQRNRILETISKVQQRFSCLVQDGFSNPGPALDVLFSSEPGEGDGTKIELQCDHAIVSRKSRSSECPLIHYGTIASGNQVIKNALERDRLRRNIGAKCVEMEAAGLMNDFPCLVIRGICDYADQHKNDLWHKYATLTASAYAKELLSVLLPAEVRAPNKVIARTPQRFPFPRNEDVVIREGIFSKLKSLLPQSQTSQNAALWGLGGSGKTQIALEFAYQRYHDYLCPVFWVHASSHEMFLKGYRNIAIDAGLSPTLQGPELLASVRSWLEDQENWLLVLDNADDLSIFGLRCQTAIADNQLNLVDFIPQGASGSILWTTRNERAVGHLVGTSRGINVGDMTEVEAVDLLCKLSGQTTSIENSAYVSEILNYLECLPLAISQAAAFIRARGVSYSEYLKRLSQERKRWRVLTEEGPKRHRLDGVPNNVMETWQITVNHLNSEYPLASWILMVMAHFHNQDIPWSIIKTIGSLKLQEKKRERLVMKDIIGQLHRSYPSKCENGDNSDSDEDSDQDSDAEEDEIRSALGHLTEFSLVRVRSERGQVSLSYDIHKLVQDATRHSIYLESKRKQKVRSSIAAETALHIIFQMFPKTQQVQSWNECAKLLPHALIVSQWPDLADKELQICEVLHRVFVYLGLQSRLNEAEKICQRVLESRRTLLGEKHADTVDCMIFLALVYSRQGRVNEAEKLDELILRLQFEILGAGHPDLISTASRIATTYTFQGRWVEAERMHREILKKQQESLGEKNTKTVETMCNLASALYLQGKQSEAESIGGKALSLYQDILGEKHPKTLVARFSLALINIQQGRLTQAEETLNDVLKSQHELLGEKHLDTLRSMSALAETYLDQGRITEAENTNKRVLALQLEVLGDKHLDTFRSMRGLASIHMRQERFHEAENGFNQVLKLQQEVFGEKHPWNVQVMSIIGAVYEKQGRCGESAAILERAVELRQDVFGDNSSEALYTVEALAAVYCRQKRFVNAEDVYVRLLRIQRETLGAAAPECLETMTNLAAVYLWQGRRDESREWYEYTLQLRRGLLGAEHPLTIETKETIKRLF